MYPQKTSSLPLRARGAWTLAWSLLTRLEGWRMVVTEGQRRLLHERLVKVIGVDQADVLMEYLPPSGWGDVARRSDVDHVERVLTMRIDMLGAELRGEMSTGMAKVTRSVNVGFASMVVGVIGSLIAALVTVSH